ncbi:CRISPR-associated endonuclease Cas2 [Ruminococcus sp. Marseille-P6503]|uniref:CRISPR-associated endonuclease Cas2 n=1 Tax=Ruminococcus sp. Marseille-P6503 TaxID=2364796 RepID=UPI000F52E5E4|nr:CRISPR-associated endonuclease Cas2 [Ruminococcus sp. Marseille-P6503]
MYVILVYDIAMDEKGKKILPKVYKICKQYLFHIQNSVFEGEISEPGLAAMKNKLNQYLRKESDSLIVFRSRNEKWLKKEFWAKEDDSTSVFI